MLKTIGDQRETRTHYYDDDSTYTFLNKEKLALSVLDLPREVKTSKFLSTDIVKQDQLIEKGKEKVIETKYFALAMLGSTKDNEVAYIVEVDYKEDNKEKKKEDKEEKPPVDPVE